MERTLRRKTGAAVAIGAASNPQASSLLKYLDADRFRIEPLRAPQLAATGVAACGTQTIHFRAQIDVRDGVEQLLVLGEHRPYQIALLVEFHVLADVQRCRDIERYDRIILQRSHDIFVAAPQRQRHVMPASGYSLFHGGRCLRFQRVVYEHSLHMPYWRSWVPLKVSSTMLIIGLFTLESSRSPVLK